MQHRKSTYPLSLIGWLLVLTIVVLPFGVLAELKEGPVRFAVIGDRTGGHTPGIYGQIVQEIELMKPDFVVTVGDMIEGYTDDYEGVEEEWSEYMSLLTPLTSPIYHTPGNHDVWDDKSLEMYRQQIGENYYSFDFKRLHFVILDVSCLNSSEELPQDQITWLEKDLKKHRKAAYTFVILHKPFWIESTAKGKADVLHEIFLKHGVDAVFTGHYHTYFSGEYDGITYTSMGSSGGSCKPLPNGLKYHFAWVTVDHRGISIAVVKKESILPWDNFTAENLHAVNELQRYGLTFLNKVHVSENYDVKRAVSTLMIQNPSTGFTFTDTLKWSVPDNWIIEPASQVVNVPVASDYTYDFQVTNTGSLYPVPEVSLALSYDAENRFNVTAQLPLARETYCYPVEEKPVIDGQVTEACWTKPVTDFYAPSGEAARTDSTSFYFAYDDDNFYLAAVCIDKDISTLAINAKEHEGAVYNDDCVGYFLQPDLNTNKVYQVYFNSKGIAFDVKFSQDDEEEWQYEREWNGEYEVKTVKAEDYWSIEACIPLDQFGVIVSNRSMWGLNFRRKQPRLKTSADWQLPIAYDPKTFGILLMR